MLSAIYLNLYTEEYQYKFVFFCSLKLFCVFPFQESIVCMTFAPESHAKVMVGNLHKLEILVFESGATVFKLSGRTILFYDK